MNNESKIYNRYEWSFLLNEVHGHHIFYLSDQDVVFPIALVSSKIFGDRLISLPFADYGGPAGHDTYSINKLILNILEIAKEFEVDFVEIRAPEKDCYHLFEANGFARRDDYFTYILPLGSTIDELWDIIGKKNRNMVRKAIKNNINIIEADCKQDLKRFYNLYLITMKSLGSPPQSFNFFDKIWDNFYPDSFIILNAISMDMCIASSLYFLHKGTIHHSYNCSLKGFQGLGQNNLLQWHIIEWGNSKGYKFLDFGRTREGAGNELFKERWGGTKIEMPYFYKFLKKKINQRDEIKYKRISFLWEKFMPYSLANKIGPYIINQIG